MDTVLHVGLNPWFISSGNGEVPGNHYEADEADGDEFDCALVYSA